MGNTWTGNWWALALRGAIAAVFALAVLTTVPFDPRAIGVVFGVYAAIDGLLAVLTALRAPRPGRPWRGMLAEGAVGLGIGFISVAIAVAASSPSARILAYLVAAWALVTGSIKIFTAKQLRDVMTGEWLLTFGGVFCILMGLVITLLPGLSALHLRALLGVVAVGYGSMLLLMGYRAHRWAQLNI